MKRVFALALALSPFLFGCSSNQIYQPRNLPEHLENEKDILDAYPGDVRRNLDLYTNVGVGWAGIVRSTVAHQEPDGLIHATTIFEHHYYDWQEDRRMGSLQLHVSPRGEGLFRTDWVLRPTDSTESGEAEAEQYASPGTLALVYGVPQAVEDDTVDLRYRYLRIITPDHFDTNRLDYGRFGEPFHYIDNSSGQTK